MSYIFVSNSYLYSLLHVSMAILASLIQSALKTFLFLSPNTGHDLNLTKNALRMETTSAINVEIKAFEEDTILCYESFFITQVQVKKSFNNLLIDKIQCVSSENILPEFFSIPLYVHNFFFGTVVLCKNFFLFICTCRISFFQNHLTPPQKLNGHPLRRSQICSSVEC